MDIQLQVVEQQKQNLLGALRIPEVIVYEDKNFGGWDYRTNLNVIYIGDRMNDQISSIVIVSGKWQFCKHRDFGAPYERILGPGYYSWVEAVGIENDQVSSFRCVEWTEQ